MTHYFCPECGGVSDKPGVCQTDGCASKGQALRECNCDADEHKVTSEGHHNEHANEH